VLLKITIRYTIVDIVNYYDLFAGVEKTVQQANASLAIYEKYSGNCNYNIFDGFENYLKALVSKVMIII